MSGSAARLQRPLAALQGAFYVFTGIWPLVHITSFVAVTGPKEDIWLVQTVGALVIAIGLALLVAAATCSFTDPVRTLGAASAAAFLLVDVVFYLHGVIAAVYLLDAAAELLLLVGWVVAWVGVRRTRGRAD